ncbi:hypothetical protein PI125_g4696 [Phytophthora idaei]|nr:hypothetical protein PI125_g4696 [Phytophthora idaei]KAG3166591.1 hypothetical protein PI126_g4160 [Phytophthora idaei]
MLVGRLVKAVMKHLKVEHQRDAVWLERFCRFLKVLVQAVAEHVLGCEIDDTLNGFAEKNIQQTATDISRLMKPAQVKLRFMWMAYWHSMASYLLKNL